MKSRFFACGGVDGLAFQIQDERENADGVNIQLKMLRDAEVRTKSHLAISRLLVLDNIMVLVQEFSKDEYFCTSAVAVMVKGQSSRIRYNNEIGGHSLGITGVEAYPAGATIYTVQCRWFIYPRMHEPEGD